ncbi:MAG TPA: GGDEF domain-containing protein, partial [Phycisphaerales bacterium]|nr:GGDEF domain-containing protein [Phycisphaerales bacterium]
VAAYDGFVPAGAGVEEILRAIDPAIGNELTATGDSRAPGPPGDAAVVAAILAGKDITQAALEVIRSRLSDPGVALLSPGPDQPAGSARVSAPGGGEHGWLVAPSANAEQLQAHAAWLSAWLRLQHQQTTLRRAAFTDPLTGAWNRRYFERFLAWAIEQARSNRLSLAVLHLDIDDFKRFNDTYGHAAADEILVEVVKMLQSVIRPTDRVCRIGGDEFAVIFHEPTGPRTPGSTPPRAAAQIAERFQRQILEQRFPKLGIDAPGRLTVSAGLATFPWDGSTSEEILNRADERARQAKQQGKNAIRMGPDAEPA